MGRDHHCPERHALRDPHAVECSGQDGRFGIGIFSLFADGHLWVEPLRGYGDRTPDRLTHHASSPNVRDMLKLGDGRLLITTSVGLSQVAGDKVDTYPIEGVVRPIQLLKDRDGGIWIGMANGLAHARDGQTNVFRRSDGLSGDTVEALFEDREGNIGWRRMKD